MLPGLFLNKMTSKTRRRLSAGLLLGLLPVYAAASTVTVDFDFSLGSGGGSGEVMFDPTLATSDSFGNYVDQANGLTEFDLTYNGHTYTASDALDSPAAPEIFLPGNDFNTTIGAGQIGLFGFWVVPGSDSGGFESLLGVERSGHVFLLTGVQDSSINFANSGSSLTLQVCPTGACPNFTEIEGAIAPEPGLLPLMALGFAGLLFIRRKVAR
jgi:hypothetical protein